MYKVSNTIIVYKTFLTEKLKVMFGMNLSKNVLESPCKHVLTVPAKHTAISSTALLCKHIESMTEYKRHRHDNYIPAFHGFVKRIVSKKRTNASKKFSKKKVCVTSRQQ